MKPSWKPQEITLSGVTDCYQPLERKLRITRGCLEVLSELGNPFSIITKNHLVTRDIDILSDMAARNAAAVFVSVTTLDSSLAEKLEPRASRPSFRLQAVRELAQAGVPVGVMMAPMIPGLTDHEIPAVLGEAASAGARWVGFVPLRLPGAVAGVFTDWAARNFPDRKEKIVNRVSGMRGGKLNDPRFGSRMQGSGPYVEQIRALFKLQARKLGLNQDKLKLSTASFRRPGEQLSLL
jgi:DNA repair photolyase